MTQDLLARLQSLPPGRRLVAIAGPPASGKSTLAETAAAELAVPLVPMDGFHLDNRVLTQMGLLPRKGAPETFDLGGFTRLIAALAGGEAAFAPLFDRAQDLGIAGAIPVPASAELVLVEGNYLLFDEPGWRDLAAFWDFSVWLDVPTETLEQRLITRWRNHGLSEAEARARAEANDLPNARRIQGARLPADLTL